MKKNLKKITAVGLTAMYEMARTMVYRKISIQTHYGTTKKCLIRQVLHTRQTI